MQAHAPKSCFGKPVMNFKSIHIQKTLLEFISI